MWILRKSSIMPAVRKNIYMLRKYSRVGIKRYTFLVIIFRVFMWPLSFINAGPRALSTCNVSNWFLKKTRSYYKGTNNDGSHLESSDSEMALKVSNIAVPPFEK